MTAADAAQAPPHWDPARFVRRVEFVDSITAADLSKSPPVHVTHRVLLDGHDITPLLQLPRNLAADLRDPDQGPTGLGRCWPHYTERPWHVEIGEHDAAVVTLDLLPSITGYPWRTGPGGVELDGNTVLITCPDGAVLKPLLLATDPPGGIPAERIRLTPTGNGAPPAAAAKWIEHGRTRYRIRMFAADIVFRSKES